MAEQVAGVKAAGTGSAAATALKMSAMLFVLVRIGGFVFGAWWGAVARPHLRALLQTAQLSDLETTLNHIFGIAMFPFTMSILVVLAPLFGWWVYSRVDTARQDATGWLAALFFCIGDAALAIIFSGVQHRLGYDVNMVGLAIGEAIVLLWVMFFMGLGFNIAKLFKSPL
ncbi:hypothetical protein [Asticcacaulis solisilvae]|uniref:hypothetical protein n=1 Tax=Asticcacaulis solisilvae TaxID=1217274 RepID=UPI003FD77544